MSKKRQDKTGTGNSRGRRITWADNDMVSAMDAVKSGHFTITAAATQFSVPRRTLDDRIKVESHMAQNLEFLQHLPPLKKIPSYLTSSIWRIMAFPSHVLWLRPLLGQLQRDVEHVIDLILSMDQGKSGGLCSNSGTLNWHFEGLIHWREAMMVQSAQYVDVTNLKDLEMRLSSG